jgi:hypothetical protein
LPCFDFANLHQSFFVSLNDIIFALFCQKYPSLGAGFSIDMQDFTVLDFTNEVNEY